MVISFVLRQLDKFEGQVDWAKVERDMNDRVRSLIPGTWFDEEAVQLMSSLLSGVKHVLADTAKLHAIMDALAAQDWMTAYNSLKALVLNAWTSGAIASTEQARVDMVA